MTIDEAKQKLVAWCNSQVGTREGPNNWNPFAEKLDKIDNLTWGPKQNQPWCGEFVLCAFVECFGVDLALELQCSSRPTSIPLCSAGANNFKQAGRWFVNPQVGDVVFFLVNGAINHTGIVTSVGMGAITTVEGNSGDMVARNTVPLNSPRIAGFGRPRWEAVQRAEKPAEAVEAPLSPAAGSGRTALPGGASQDTSSAFAVNLRTLRRGDVSEIVRAAQMLLIGRGWRCGPWGADGEFGPDTEDGVKRYQRSRELAVDGVIGPETWRALLGVAS